jgi:P27 family predicted phage terminase small subunit
LVGYGSDEWSRVAEPLWRMGLLSPLDSAALSAYCWSFKVWREANEAIEQVSPRDRAALVQIGRTACADMIRYAGLFGMSPSSRLRVAAGRRPNQPSKFDGLIG